MYSQSYSFSSSQVQMWELIHKEDWALKNWYFHTVVLEKTLESPLDYKEIKLVNSKGNQPWICIGRTDAEAEAPVLWPCDPKSQLIGKAPDAGNDWRQKKEAREIPRDSFFTAELNCLLLCEDSACLHITMTFIFVPPVKEPVKSPALPCETNIPSSY